MIMRNLLRSERGDHLPGLTEEVDIYFEPLWSPRDDHKAAIAAWRDIASIHRQAVARVKARVAGSTVPSWDLTICARLAKVSKREKR